MDRATNHKYGLRLESRRPRSHVLAQPLAKERVGHAPLSVTLDDQGRAVKVSSGGDLVLSGPGGTLKIAAGGIELVSNTNLKLQANANLSAQANALLDVKTSAILSIHGSLVKIN